MQVKGPNVRRPILNVRFCFFPTSLCRPISVCNAVKHQAIEVITKRAKYKINLLFPFLSFILSEEAKQTNFFYRKTQRISDSAVGSSVK